VFKEGKMKMCLFAPDIRGPIFLYFIKDFILTVYYVIKLKRKFNIFIGYDPFCALIGTILRTLGFIKIVVLYTVDWSPLRFSNRFLNRIYHLLDRIAVKHSDFIWSLSEAIYSLRKKQGVKAYRNLLVPIGVPFELISNNPTKEENNHRIVYVGGLNKPKGAILIVEALPKIVKIIKDIELVIIGEGHEEKTMKEIIRKNNLEKHVKFFKRISFEELLTKISMCSVGLAPYDTSHVNSVKYVVEQPDIRYANPGKVKEYLACGVPVILTRISNVADEIEKNNAGVIINYDVDELANAVIKLLHNPKLRQEMANNAREMGKKYNYSEIAVKALKQSFLLYVNKNRVE
jgi:glycosyltransferase involved in cell wall biosynthesis